MQISHRIGLQFKTVFHPACLWADGVYPEQEKDIELACFKLKDMRPAAVTDRVAGGAIINTTDTIVIE
jgi:hypothetical protein